MVADVYSFDLMFYVLNCISSTPVKGQSMLLYFVIFLNGILYKKIFY